MLVLAAERLAVALFSAAAFAAPFSSSAALLFCCAQSGKAKSALITSAAHQLRISFLPCFINRFPFGSRARLLTARCAWRAPLDASQLLNLSLLPLQATAFPHTQVRTQGEICRSNSTRRNQVIPQFAFGATTSSLPVRPLFPSTCSQLPTANYPIQRYTS